MSPAQAELEARDVEIAQLTSDLTACRMRLTEALGACDLARETMAILREERDLARRELEDFAAKHDRRARS